MGPKCSATVLREGCLSSSAERAWSRSQSRRVNHLSGVVQGEGVGRRGPDGPGVGPAQQPVPAVGQDAHADAALPLRLGQVVVELLYVLGVGVEAAGGAYPALGLDEGVEGGQVDGAAGALGGRVLLDDLIAPGEAGGDEEIADGAGDVRLGLAQVVAPQHLGGGRGACGVVVVQVRGRLRHLLRGSWSRESGVRPTCPGTLRRRKLPPRRTGWKRRRGGG